MNSNVKSILRNFKFLKIIELNCRFCAEIFFSKMINHNRACISLLAPSNKMRSDAMKLTHLNSTRNF